MKGFTGPLCGQGSYLLMKMSHEHSGFTFEKDMSTAASLLKQHSGGHCTEALNLYTSFQKSGKEPEPVDSPCKWMEKEVVVQTIETTATAEKSSAKNASPASANTPEGTQVAANISKWETLKAEKETQQRTVTNVSSPSGKRGGKYQDQYMTGNVSQEGTAEAGTRGTEVDDDDNSFSRQSSWPCPCCCFRNKTIVASSANEATPLMKR